MHSNNNVIDNCNEMLGGCFEHNGYVENQYVENNFSTDNEEWNNIINCCTLFAIMIQMTIVKLLLIILMKIKKIVMRFFVVVEITIYMLIKI